MTSTELVSESTRAGQLVGDAMARFFGIPTRVTSLEEQLAGVSDQLDRQQEVLDQLVALGTDDRAVLRALVEQNKCLENASKRQAELSEAHYQQHVLDPLARQVFPLIDDLYEFGREATADRQVHSWLSALKAQLLELLRTYGIEMYCSQTGAPFDPKRMRAGTQVPVSRPDEDRTVSSVLKVGFLRGEAVLRHECVELRVYRSTALVASCATSLQECV